MTTKSRVWPLVLDSPKRRSGWRKKRNRAARSHTKRSAHRTMTKLRCRSLLHFPEFIIPCPLCVFLIFVFFFVFSGQSFVRSFTLSSHRVLCVFYFRISLHFYIYVDLIFVLFFCSPRLFFPYPLPSVVVSVICDESPQRKESGFSDAFHVPLLTGNTIHAQIRIFLSDAWSCGTQERTVEASRLLPAFVGRGPADCREGRAQRDCQNIAKYSRGKNNSEQQWLGRNCNTWPEVVRIWCRQHRHDETWISQRTAYHGSVKIKIN